MGDTWTHTAHAQQQHFGPRAVDRIGEVVKGLGGRSVLLVTSEGRLASGAGGQLVKRLGRNLVATFSGARPHVPTPTVQAALAMARDRHIDTVVSFGGGSCIDLAKAICFFTEQEAGSPGTSHTDRPIVAHVAVPTTYAGAEATPAFGMTDPTSRRASGAAAPTLAPVAVIYDPELTVGLAPALTAQSAFAAIAHGVEAAWSTQRSPEAEVLGLACIGKVASVLPYVLSEHDDVRARAALLEAAVLGGRALENATMGVHHGLCQLLCGRTGIPYGLAHAILLPHAVAYNTSAAPDAVGAIAGALGADDAVAALEQLRDRAGMPERLSDVGIDDDDLDAVARMAPGHPAVQANPRAVTEDEARMLLEAAS